MVVVTIKGLMMKQNGFLRVLPLFFHEDSILNDVTFMYTSNVNLEGKKLRKTFLNLLKNF